LLRILLFLLRGIQFIIDFILKIDDRPVCFFLRTAVLEFFLVLAMGGFISFARVPDGDQLAFFY
jgi:hypothetical protein